MKNLICPVCGDALVETDNQKSLACANKHLFDKAKQGHINLLLSHKKKSKQPGDTPDMVNARTRFLNQGYYQTVCEALIDLIQEYGQFPERSEVNYIDIACGEGYYTQRIHDSLAKTASITTTGFDISTPAIKAATKRDKNIQWLIASANQIPVEEHSQNLLSCLFCRVDYEAAAKAAANEAVFIVAETGPSHLIELREQLYDDVFDDKAKQLPTNTASFNLVDTVKKTAQIEIKNNEDIVDLLAMTPHFWRVKPEKKKALERLNTIEVSLDLNFHMFRNQP